MTDPIPVTDAIRACERLIAICDTATPGPWFTRSNGFGLFYGEPGIRVDGEIAETGWNIAHRTEQTKANGGFLVVARAVLKPLASLALQIIHDQPEWSVKGQFFDYHTLYPAVAAIIAHLDATEPDWRTK